MVISGTFGSRNRHLAIRRSSSSSSFSSSSSSMSLWRTSLLVFCLCCTFSFVTIVADAQQQQQQIAEGENGTTNSNDSNSNRQIRARRHPKSRSRSRGANAECVQAYRQRIEHHCRYPSMDQPCFQQNEAEWIQAVEDMAKNCCQSGLCSVEDFEDLCCRTMECLEKCYGPTFLQRFRNRFRYFDILNRPHPHSKGGRTSREAMDGAVDEAGIERDEEVDSKEEIDAHKQAEEEEEKKQALEDFDLSLNAAENSSGMDPMIISRPESEDSA